jgi:PilZ domain-containing protein
MTDSYSEIKNVRPLRRSAMLPLDRRWALAWYGTFTPGAGQVEDASADGAKVRVGRVPIDGENVTLVLPNSSPIEARIAWRRRDHIGVQFLTRQSWIVELLLRVKGTEEWFPVIVA